MPTYAEAVSKRSLRHSMDIIRWKHIRDNYGNYKSSFIHPESLTRRLSYQPLQTNKELLSPLSLPPLQRCPVSILNGIVLGLSPFLIVWLVDVNGGYISFNWNLIKTSRGSGVCAYMHACAWCVCVCVCSCLCILMNIVSCEIPQWKVST